METLIPVTKIKMRTHDKKAAAAGRLAYSCRECNHKIESIAVGSLSNVSCATHPLTAFFLVPHLLRIATKFVDRIHVVFCAKTTTRNKNIKRENCNFVSFSVAVFGFEPKIGDLIPVIRFLWARLICISRVDNGDNDATMQETRRIGEIGTRGRWEWKVKTNSFFHDAINISLLSFNQFFVLEHVIEVRMRRCAAA